MVTSPRAASEPLLWLQLLGAALLPLEALLVLLLLAGSDPGPVPSLERLLCWSIGGLAPALALWRRPADVWSLLLVQTPARGRRDLQRRLSALQQTRSLNLALALGSGLLLILIWRLDGAAALASSFAPLPNAPRLLDLLLTAPLLALMLWQWQQSLQALWLLSRSPAAIAASEPLSATDLAQRRLSLGLPLLLPQPLEASAPAPKPKPESAPHSGPAPAAEGEAERKQNPQTPQSGNEEPFEVPVEEVEAGEDEQVSSAPQEEARECSGEIVDVEVEALEAEAQEPETPEAEPGRAESDPPAHASSTVAAVSVEPEQGTEQDEGSDLDQPIG